MNRAVAYCKGYHVLEFRGAASEHALNSLMEAGIPFWDIRRIDVLTLQITVLTKSLNVICDIVGASMCEVVECREFGLKHDYGILLMRPVLLIMVMLSLAAALVLPQYVFFLDVDGNEQIPDSMILRELSDLGINFGIKGSTIRPHWIKNQLLNRVPNLQWVTLTQNGCRASVVVRERPKTLDTKSRKGFANVIANQSGIISKMSVFAGQAQCKVGDTVNIGDILVSGIVDLERVYVIENADAEIFARTWRMKSVCIPKTYVTRPSCSKENRCIWLTVGDRRIKIFGNSGIFVDSCDKMIKKLGLSLPGGLRLPVTLEIETIRFYDQSVCAMDRSTAQQILMERIREDTQLDMRAGEILQEQYRCSLSDGRYIVDAVLECHEMIAEVVPAKWNNEDVIHG